MPTYVLHTISDDAKTVRRSTMKNCPEYFADTIIALELVRKHKGTVFSKLLECVQEQSSRMAYQVAFADEDCTYIVTEMSES